MQKEALISMLKKEFYELQDKEHEFIILNDEINNVEAKYSILKDEKERIENEHRYANPKKESKWILTAKILQNLGLKSIVSRCRFTSVQSRSKTSLGILLA
jgi:hypothetical protein